METAYLVVLVLSLLALAGMSWYLQARIAASRIRVRPRSDAAPAGRRPPVRR